MTNEKWIYFIDNLGKDARLAYNAFADGDNDEGFRLLRNIETVIDYTIDIWVAAESVKRRSCQKEPPKDNVVAFRGRDELPDDLPPSA